MLINARDVCAHRTKTLKKIKNKTAVKKDDEKNWIIAFIRNSDVIGADS